ncbi:MAG: DUF1232 domain-containing protein [Clostridiales Family XIII bacterium]|jgi:uncharacterized membrane protein YkvA (DUF1232 family)|nr:DUF1232 domain-containing protein [Clostridiales Family XIII bacterium]
MHFLSWRIIGRRIKAIRHMMADRTVPKRKKLLVVAGIVYLFLPFDIIPPVLFPFGWIDDLIIWLWIIWHLKDTLDVYWNGEKTVDLSGRYKGKKIIDGDFEIKDDSKK